jgi:type II secretory pathway pseudopilin PulG
MRCTSCHEDIAPGARFCSRCGAAVTSVQAPKPTNKVLVGVVIAVALLIPLLIVAAAMVLPWIAKGTQRDREAAAIHRIMLIHNAERDFQSQHGRYGTLAELGPRLARANIGGYRFSLTASNGIYIINADPIVYGSTGRRCFYSDQSLVIRQNWGPEPATDQSAELQ